MTTLGALYVASLLVLHVVETTFNKRQSSSAVSKAQVQHADDADGEVATKNVDRQSARHNRSSLHSATSLRCDGKRCQGKLHKIKITFKNKNTLNVKQTLHE